MIFTIGYDGKGFTTDNLCKILDDAQAVLIDVRLTPFSRLKGWGSKQLIEAVGEHRYIQRRDLGGGTDDKTEGIEYLKQFDGLDNPNCVLLCKEENPSECHRHYEICLDQNDDTGTKHNFPNALHIFRGALYRAERLTAKMVDQSEEILSVIYADELQWFCDIAKSDPGQFHAYLQKNKAA